VLTVSSLTRGQLGRQLAATGILLQTGAFVTHVTSDIGQVADGIHALYGDYPLCAAGRFTDFYVNFARTGGLRRWFRPQVRFDYDGLTPFRALPIDQAFPMFEWVLNWCVSTRANRYLIVHAAVVERDGRCAILPAPPGSGKSTLCAALVSKGWRLLSDELTLVRLESGAIVPLPRPISLKNASIDIVRRYAPDSVLSREVAETVKGTIAHLKAPTDSIRRADECARPAWIVFPKYVAGAATRLEPIAPARAFMRVAENAFNYSLLGADGFAAMAGLIEASVAYDFSYSELDEAIDVFARLARTGP
jgi:HprK-related kinase A